MSNTTSDPHSNYRQWCFYPYCPDAFGVSHAHTGAGSITYTAGTPLPVRAEPVPADACGYDNDDCECDLYPHTHHGCQHPIPDAELHADEHPISRSRGYSLAASPDPNASTFFCTREHADRNQNEYVRTQNEYADRGTYCHPIAGSD